jgi:hypothetical protein
MKGFAPKWCRWIQSMVTGGSVGIKINDEIGPYFEQKLSCWKAKYLSYGGKLVLLNSVLSSLPMFMMSFFEMPKGVIKNLDHYRSRFFWQGSSQKHRYRIAKWDILCRPKDQGGLGILDLQLQNKCPLAKWLVNLLNTDGIWQTLLCNKYLRLNL